MRSLHQNLTITPNVFDSKDKVLLNIPCNIYAVWFVHRKRQEFLDNNADNINEFVVLAQTEREAIQFVIDWWENMSQSALPVELYTITTNLIVRDVTAPCLGVINGVYRW